MDWRCQRGLCAPGTPVEGLRGGVHSVVLLSFVHQRWLAGPGKHRALGIRQKVCLVF